MQFFRFRLNTFLWVTSIVVGFFCCVSCRGGVPGDKTPSSREQILLVPEHQSSTPDVQSSLAAETPAKSASPPIEVDFADVTGQAPRFLGVEYSWIDQDQDLYLERYRRLHANVIRVQINQDFFEPINDNDDPDFSELVFSSTLPLDGELGTSMTYDAMFKALAAEFPEMYFQVNVWLCARWNAADPNGYLGLGGAFPPIDYAEHREFIRALANWLVFECGLSPEHLSLTFTNEPNLRAFFVGNLGDLARMAEETRAALDQVSPLIQLGGLDEVHGTSWTDEFHSDYPVACCDMWTCHAYESGLPSLWAALLGRIDHLGEYGLVWVTEFADIVYGSPDGEMDFSSREAALEFAELLARLWPTGVDGVIHFRLSDTYADRLGGWVGHGLFADARGTHSGGQAYAPFPAYWVFANMYRELGGGQLVRTMSPEGLTVIGARKGDGSNGSLAVWVTNSSAQSYVTSLTVQHYPATEALVQVFDNLAGDTPIETLVIVGDELTFGISVPNHSSYLFVLTGIEDPSSLLPVILK